MLTLYGDGESDDTEAFQSLIDGKSVIYNGKIFTPQDDSRGMKINISRPIRMSKK